MAYVAAPPPVARKPFPAPELAATLIDPAQAPRSPAGVARQANVAGWTATVTAARGTWPTDDGEPATRSHFEETDDPAAKTRKVMVRDGAKVVDSFLVRGRRGTGRFAALWVDGKFGSAYLWTDGTFPRSVNYRTLVTYLTESSTS